MQEADPLYRSFIAETGEHLDEFEAAVMDLEARPDDRASLQQIFRLAHTIKGTSGSLGFHAIAELGHAIEDLLADLESRGAPATPAVCDLLFEGVDKIREMLPETLAGSDRLPPGGADLIHRLRRQRQGPERDAARIGARSSMPTEMDMHRAPGARAQTVRIDVAKLDRIADLIGELAAGRRRIGHQIRTVGGTAAARLLDDIEQGERLSEELEDLVQTARMVPIGPWLSRHARPVRDIARAHGKAARLVVEGGDVEVDMTVIERLADPLTHLIRNALDHGIEPPEARKARGKGPTGTITLSAWYEGGRIALRISDDGAGLSRARIAAAARERGMALDPEGPSLEGLESLLFERGFSTASEVSDLSGRGMGLAIVRQHVEALHGSIRIDSVEGAFTSFTMRLPLTLATIDGLSVGAGEDRFVIPVEAVIECIDLPHGSLPPDRHDLLDLRGQSVPCARLRELLSLGGAAPPRQSAVVVDQDGKLAALVVDTLHGEGRTLIKPLSRLVSGIPGIAGSTILGDGRVALILDIAALLRRLAPRSSFRRTEDARAAQEDPAHR